MGNARVIIYLKSVFVPLLQSSCCSSLPLLCFAITSLLHNQFLILSLTLTKFDLILLSVQIVSLVAIDLVVVGHLVVVDGWVSDLNGTH